MRIIPAIDIIDGKCVRLTKGDYTTKKIYDEKPLEVAKRFEDHGIKFLHLVDLDGAKSKQIVNYKVLEQIAARTKLTVDFGGGLKGSEDVRIAFECGATQVTGGSIAVKKPATFLSWIAQYGSDKIILGADALNEKVAISGWLEESNRELIPFIEEYQREGLQYVICTDISKDGMLNGPAISLYERILKHSKSIAKKPIRLIASGGVTSMDDLPKLAAIGCEGAIIGKALYEEKITLKQLENFVINAH